jgi:hypothetical protein
MQDLEGTRSFADHAISKAIYATAWDGNVVFEAAADGASRRVAADGTASP